MKYKVTFIVEPNRPCDMQYIEEMSEVIRYELNQQGDKVKDICIEEVKEVELDESIGKIIRLLQKQKEDEEAYDVNDWNKYLDDGSNYEYEGKEW